MRIHSPDLNDGFDKVLEKPDQKRQLRVLVMKYNIFSTFTLFLGRFSRIRIFPNGIRIYGQSGSGLRKKSLIQIREKNLDPKHCLQRGRHWWYSILLSNFDFRSDFEGNELYPEEFSIRKSPTCVLVSCIG